MKTSAKIFSILGIVFLFTACGEKPVDDTKTDDTAVEQTFEGQTDFEKRIADTDANLQLIPANSLIFTHTNGSTEEVTAFLNDKQEIQKLEESFKDGITGNYGSRIFYIEKRKRYATKEIYLDNKMKSPMFVERHSFYDKNGKVKYSRQREAEYEVDLELAAFKLIDAVDCPVDNVMQIINQVGPYELTFQGFTSNGEMDFVILGENVQEGFTTSLAVQHKEGDIQKLYMNEKAYIGDPLEVEFERMIDSRDFEFQVLLSLKIKK